MKAATKIEILKRLGLWKPKHYNPKDLCFSAESRREEQTLENLEEVVEEVVEEKPKKKSRKKRVEQ